MSVPGHLDEGYIKFSLAWERTESLQVPKALVEMRNRLRGLGLLGVYVDSGIGYGNVSIRDTEAGGQFFISGSGTGAVERGGAELFAVVDAYDISKNQVWCKGPVPASSESLTHAMLYACSPEIKVVLHVHSLALWERLLWKVPTTGAEVAYGTPEMALAVKELYAEGPLREGRLMAMAGHPEGLVSFGRDVEDAFGPLGEYI